MATGSYEFNIKTGENTISSSKSNTWNFVGTRMSGTNADVRKKIPKFATINSASCTVRVKRDGTSSLKMYNHDAAWLVTVTQGGSSTTLWSQNQAIARSYNTFTYDCLSYINSNDANAGVASSIYVLTFRASGDLAKAHTYDIYRVNMTFTYPTITVNGTVNNSSYGEVVSDTHTLGSPIDIGAVGVWGTQTCKLTAKPKAGYRFVQWSDGNTNATRDVVLSEDVLTAHNTTFTYKAVFEPIKYNITVTASPAEGGQSASIQAQHGTEIILQAIANEGYKFVKWSDGNTDAIRTVIATSDANYTAEFAPIMFAVATDTLCDDGTAGGIVTGGGSYAAGASVTLTAIPNEGYEFVQWDDGNTNATREVTVTEDATYTARFKIMMYQIHTDFTIIADVVPDDISGLTTGGGVYVYGSEVTLTAMQDDAGYEFVQWEDGVTDAVRTVIVTGLSTYVAIFKARKFSLTTSVTPECAGLVSGGGTYDYRTTVELTVTCNPGFKFVQWSDGTTWLPKYVTLYKNETITAIFEPDEIKHIYIGTSQVKSVYYSAETNTITFVIDEVSDGTDVVGTVDGYHLAISNTAPTDAIEVAGVYVGTKQVHSS